jgi:ribulose-5-phosphate 4-epimerase/fuculose-1-phosphate aldolase
VTEAELRERMCELGRSLFERGLTSGSSGNLSARLDDGFLMTPTGSSLGRLVPARLSRLAPDGALVSGDPPTKEAFLHRALYLARPGAGGVVHLHSTHAAAVSCLAGLDPDDALPPLTPYFVMKIGRLPLVPYHRPGDPRLGDVIRGLAARRSAVLLANHGPVVSGASLEDAANAAEELEETARLFLLLRGQPVRTLSPEQLAELAAVFKLDLS